MAFISYVIKGHSAGQRGLGHFYLNKIQGRNRCCLIPNLEAIKFSGERAYCWIVGLIGFTFRGENGSGGEDTVSIIKISAYFFYPQNTKIIGHAGQIRDRKFW